MRITISGKHRSLDNQTIRKALHYFAKELMPNKHVGVCVSVEVTHTLRKNEGIDGGLSWQGKSGRRPRDFVLEIDARQGKRTALRILAHEMVHVKQYVLGELRDGESKKHVTWRGKRHPAHEDDRYWSLPWEIEAYGREPGLYYRLRRDVGI